MGKILTLSDNHIVVAPFHSVQTFVMAAAGHSARQNAGRSRVRYLNNGIASRLMVVSTSSPTSPRAQVPKCRADDFYDIIVFPYMQSVLFLAFKATPGPHISDMPKEL